jgi:multidrug resistance protein, MATE family
MQVSPHESYDSRHQGSILQVLRVAIPLILATSGHGIQLFCDRIMLAHYSPEAIQAALPAGVTHFTFFVFFLCIVGYATSFVAQYFGSGHPERIGPAVWQGLWTAVLGGLVMMTLVLISRPLFALMGHETQVRELEIIYFNVLCLFGVPNLMGAALICFWTGRGRTWVTMALTGFTCGMNIVFNWIFIYGHLGSPRMGILGAALGTGLGSVCGFVLCLALFLRPVNRWRFNTLPRPLFEKDLLLRLLCFGLPNGVHGLLDLASFNIFVAVLGKYGAGVREACAIALSTNALVFLPMIGLGTSAGMLLAQAVGARDIPHARRAVRNCAILVSIYALAVTVVFSLFPEFCLSLFSRQGDQQQVETMQLAAHFLRFIAAFMLFDGFCNVYSNAIRSAGDTRWPMFAGIIMSWTLFAGPCLLAHWLLGDQPWVVDLLWVVLVAYVGIAAAVFVLRYFNGKWQSMQLIEALPEVIVPDEAVPPPML